ncbi:MAG: hypothetical protein SFU98_16720 [Leptospiraceae bacterium]|nr:hypothetical protein [Leptospiraceae bacterium]
MRIIIGNLMKMYGKLLQIIFYLFISSIWNNCIEFVKEKEFIGKCYLLYDAEEFAEILGNLSSRTFDNYVVFKHMQISKKDYIFEGGDIIVSIDSCDVNTLENIELYNEKKAKVPIYFLIFLKEWSAVKKYISKIKIIRNGKTLILETKDINY